MAAAFGPGPWEAFGIELARLSHRVLLVGSGLALDDVGSAPDAAQQKSWNWRSIFGGVGRVAGLYPLEVTAMTAATSYTGTVVAGGAAFYRLSVPANSTATVSLGGQSGTAASTLRLVIVRTK